MDRQTRRRPLACSTWALASAGPSGVADIRCSVDGAPYTAFAGAGARIPVQGVGPHTVSCFAQNNAIDASLKPASSALATWHLSIRQPTIAGISFGTRLLDALRCHRLNVHVTSRAHWVTIRRHGKRHRVHRRAHTGTRREVRCHPRVVIRNVRRRGHVERKRVVLLPHTVELSNERVGLGHRATVSGWIGLADGTALGGVPVQVITATDNGLGRWRVATVVSTTADGLWHAELRAGPSRLIAAVYPGSGTTEPATSGHVHLIVPTKVMLSIRPRIARWGHTIKISGRVLGGNIPAGKLLRLRIGTAGIYSTVGYRTSAAAAGTEPPGPSRPAAASCATGSRCQLSPRPTTRTRRPVAHACTLPSTADPVPPLLPPRAVFKMKRSFRP